MSAVARYKFRRGAAVLVHSSCRKQPDGWVPEGAQTNDMARLKRALTLRGFDVVLELGPNTDTPQPTVADIEEKFTSLATSWGWGDDHFDALVVVLCAHGSLNTITGWPLEGEPDKKSGPLDLGDAVFRRFQLPIQGQSPTLASEALIAKLQCLQSKP